MREQSFALGRDPTTAPPEHVLRALWDEVYRDATGRGPAPYDPEIYTAVFLKWLRARHVEVIPIDQALDGSTSAYDLGVPVNEISASPAEVASTMAHIDRMFGERQES